MEPTGRKGLSKEQKLLLKKKHKLNFKFGEQRGDGIRLVYIDEGLLPYIFRFTEKSLYYMRIALSVKQNFPIAAEVFELLKSRIIPKRKTSRTGRAPTRMKYEEKIKFVMRVIEEQLAFMYGRTPEKLTKFNIDEQKNFFQREDVRRHFLQQMPLEIQKRIKKNYQKVEEFTNHIFQILDAENEGRDQFARNLIRRYLKTSQLPWSHEMFEDIKHFSLNVFRDFVYSKEYIQMIGPEALKQEEDLFMARSEYDEQEIEKKEQLKSENKIAESYFDECQFFEDFLKEKRKDSSPK